jgi:hypothetical protein
MVATVIDEVTEAAGRAGRYGRDGWWMTFDGQPLRKGLGMPIIFE